MCPNMLPLCFWLLFQLSFHLWSWLPLCFMWITFFFLFNWTKTPMCCLSYNAGPRSCHCITERNGEHGPSIQAESFCLGKCPVCETHRLWRMTHRIVILTSATSCLSWFCFWISSALYETTWWLCPKIGQSSSSARAVVWEWLERVWDLEDSSSF